MIYVPIFSFLPEKYIPTPRHCIFCGKMMDPIFCSWETKMATFNQSLDLIQNKQDYFKNIKYSASKLISEKRHFLKLKQPTINKKSIKKLLGSGSKIQTFNSSLNTNHVWKVIKPVKNVLGISHASTLLTYLVEFIEMTLLSTIKA